MRHIKIHKKPVTFGTKATVFLLRSFSQEYPYSEAYPIHSIHKPCHLPSQSKTDDAGYTIGVGEYTISDVISTTGGADYKAPVVAGINRNNIPI